MRKDRDSNPGYSCPYNGFRDRPDRPLRHLSLWFCDANLVKKEFSCIAIRQKNKNFFLSIFYIADNEKVSNGVTIYLYIPFRHLPTSSKGVVTNKNYSNAVEL